jgi:acylphosphatase
MDNVTRHIFVRGRVQGVGYRAWVEGEAIARQLEGGCETAGTALWRPCSPDR